MNLTHQAAHAPAARPVPVRDLIQRCGGINCPPGTCDHTDDAADAVHRSASRAAAPGGVGVPASVLRVLDTPGTPLDASTRTSMEARLGHDFGHVRVHTDDEAARSAESIKAHAYTFGSHVVMGADRFQPHTPVGRLLLAHELTHVAQQTGTSGPATSVSDPGDPSEREAEDSARAAADLRPAPAPVESAQPPAVSRVESDTPAVAAEPDALYEFLADMRATVIPPAARGKPDSTLSLSASHAERLLELSQGPQSITAEVDLTAPKKEPSLFKGTGSSVRAEHLVSFDLGDHDPESLRYIRFVKAARVGRGRSAKTLKLSGTVPGYVSFADAPPVDMPEATDDASYLAQLTRLVNNQFEAAMWSFDGPARVPPTLNIKDTPGLASDFLQYPIVQRYEFIGVLFDVNAKQILNVIHYSDSLASLREDDPVRRLPSVAP
jgi:hypothetical protein